MTGASAAAEERHGHVRGVCQRCPPVPRGSGDIAGVLPVLSGVTAELAAECVCLRRGSMELLENVPE